MKKKIMSQNICNGLLRPYRRNTEQNNMWKKLWHPKEAAKKAYSDKYGQNLYKALVEFSASHI